MNILSSMFSKAFDKTAEENKNNTNLVKGENGSLAQASPAQSELDFNGILCEYFLLMRGSTEEQIIDILNRLHTILESNLLSPEKRKEFLVNLLKITLFIREPRSGKGERQIFYKVIEYLFFYGGDYKKMCFKILDLLGEFGYYKDYNNIYTLTSYQELKYYIIDLYCKQLSKDLNETDNTKLSLCAKWAPRENSKYDKMAKTLAFKLNLQLKQYRQILSKLNKRLNTVQTYMCQKHWSDIDFKNVPSVSMTNLTKAFQDEKVDKRPKNERTHSVKNIRRGRRFSKKIINTRRHKPEDPDYEDREKCRQNLIEHIYNGGKVNSAVTNLSQIIDKYLHGDKMDITWEAQWVSRVEEIQKMISELSEKPRIFPMVDLSSSMSGDPMIYAITFGLFTSMIMDNPLTEEEFCFANRFMSFASEPNLVKLPRFSQLDSKKQATLKEKQATLKEKVEIMQEWTQGGRWGGSTNIHKAIDLLLNIALTNKVPQSDMPKILAIFSDMQFDQGDRNWNNTSYDNICDKFKNAGYEVPHVLFWNLRANTIGFQVKADTPNSSMLSGYSTRMLDLFLSADLKKMQDEFSKNTENDNFDENKYKKNTTLDLLNKALEHKMFENYVEEFTNIF
jgi:hypothetical protein